MCLSLGDTIFGRQTDNFQKQKLQTLVVKACRDLCAAEPGPSTALSRTCPSRWLLGGLWGKPGSAEVAQDTDTDAVLRSQPRSLFPVLSELVLVSLIPWTMSDSSVPPAWR